MKNHMKKDHKTKRSICPACNDNFNTLSLLCDHFSEIHMDKKSNPKCNEGENMDMFISLYDAQLHEPDDSCSESDSE